MNSTKKSTIIPFDNVLAYNRSGFLLMELLIAFVVLMGLATVVAHYQVQNACLTAQARKQAEVLNVLMNAVHEYKISGTLPPYRFDENSLNISCCSVPVEIMPDFNVLEFTAQWQGVMGQQSMKLVVSERSYD